MPKLPEQKNASVLEVVEKNAYGTGQITFPKIPKLRNFAKKYIKFLLIFVVAVAVCFVAYSIGKPILERRFAEKPEVVAPVDELANFKKPDKAAMGQLNLQNNFTFYVDRIDADKKIIYGKDSDGKELAIRVLGETKIQVLPADNRPVVFATDSADVRKFEDIKEGLRLSVVTVEDPGTDKYLNAVAIIVD